MNVEENNDAEVQDSSPENEEAQGEPSQEGENTPVKPAQAEKPLHKDERFLEVYRGKKELERKYADLERRLEELSKAKETPSSEPAAAPEWFVEAFGENPKLWQNYQAHSKAEKESIIQQVRQEMEKETSAESQADQEAVQVITDQLDDMEAEGIEFDRNLLIKFAYENPIVGEDGNISMRKAYELMSKLQPANDTRDERKRLTATGKGAVSEPKSDGYFTDKDFEKKGWGGLR